jgi:hypothetical protein
MKEELVNRIIDKYIQLEDKIKNMNKDIKRYLISSAISFLTSFFGSLAFLLASIDYSVAETLTWSAIGGLAFTALRAGIKGLSEYLMTLKKQ